MQKKRNIISLVETYNEVDTEKHQQHTTCLLKDLQ